jgi:hypothetical protein
MQPQRLITLVVALLLSGCIIDPFPTVDVPLEETAKVLAAEQSQANPAAGIPLKLNQTYRFKVPTHTWWDNSGRLITLGSWKVSPVWKTESTSYPAGATFKLTRLRRDGISYEARVSINNSSTDYELGIDFIDKMMLNRRCIEEVNDGGAR